MQTGADYSDFTDRFDEYARMNRELGKAISFLDEIVQAAKEGWPGRRSTPGRLNSRRNTICIEVIRWKQNNSMIQVWPTCENFA